MATKLMMLHGDKVSRAHIINFFAMQQSSTYMNFFPEHPCHVYADDSPATELNSHDAETLAADPAESRSLSSGPSRGP